MQQPIICISPPANEHYIKIMEKQVEKHEHRFYVEHAVLDDGDFDKGPEKNNIAGHAVLVCETCGEVRRTNILNH